MATITGTSGNDLLDGTASDDTISGLAGNDTLNGLGGNDSLDGGAGNDVLVGGAGTDSLFGGDGSDLLRQSPGADLLDGGAGIDWYDTLDFTQTGITYGGSVGVNVNLATGTSDSGGAGIATILSFENVYGTAGNDVFVGGDPTHATDSLGNRITERFRPGAGYDTLNGAGGFDRAQFVQSPAGVIVNLSAGPIVVGADTVAGGTARDGFGTTDTLVNIEEVRGSGFNDYIRGSDDTSVQQNLNGDGGNDTIDGGAGIDFASYQTVVLALGGVNAFIENGSGTVTDPTGGTGTLTNIEGLIGTNSNDTLAGGLGDQWFRGRGGSDTINGGAGNDWVSYTNDPAGVTVNLTAGTATDGWGGVWAMGGTDTLTSIENAEGSDFADSIVGSTGANELRGGDGNDSLAGGDGNDTLDGGAGIDTAIFSSVYAAYTIASTATGYTVSGPDGTDTLSTIERLQFSDKTLDLGTGSGTGEVIPGTEGNDTLTGGSGNDTLIGSAGNDTLDGGAGTDTADYAAAPGAVTVNLATGTATGADGNDTLASIENVRGSAFDDTLIGNGGGNVLDGRGGADTMQGAAGDDTYYVDNANDVVTEVSNTLSLASFLDDTVALAAIEGITDTVIAAINYSLANVAYVENLTLNEAGTATIATGNELENVLTGNALNNTLSGLAGNDTLDGGSGIDTAVFNSNRAANTITKTTSGFTVAGSEGSDTLSNVERFQFSDKKVAVDLGVGEAAGNSVRIIGAAFDAPAIQQHPDYVGIGLQLFDSGMSILEVCQLAIGAMGSPGNVAFVTTVYTSVVGVAPSAADRDYFVGLLQGSGGTMTQADLLVLAANADVNAVNINLVGLQASGVEFV